MTTNIIPVGTSEINSADLVVTAAAPLTVLLAGHTDATCTAQVQIKDSTLAYTTIATLSGSNKYMLLSAPGTYRVKRPLCAKAFGVDQAP
jgi:hypothetical protein